MNQSLPTLIKLWLLITIGSMHASAASAIEATKAQTEKHSANPITQRTQISKEQKTKVDRSKQNSKTQINFDETLINGKSIAPEGFFIQGRRTQKMRQMVKLRSNFRQKLIQSSHAVESIVK